MAAREVARPFSVPAGKGTTPTSGDLAGGCCQNPEGAGWACCVTSPSAATSIVMWGGSATVPCNLLGRKADIGFRLLSDDIPFGIGAAVTARSGSEEVPSEISE